ncbi:MAG: hypothetical protein QM811_18290 [Pirellulales bacterium]
MRALEQNAEYVGYWDADLATPLDAIAEFQYVLAAGRRTEIVVGSRMPLLGRRIQRHAIRHVLGRSFATVVSRMLGIPIYDTQCGAKLFRVNPVTTALFAEPFRTGWIFDAEILARYSNLLGCRYEAAGRIFEQPLDTWEDVPGSKLKAKHFVKAALELGRIYRHYLLPYGTRYAVEPTTGSPDVISWSKKAA